MNSMEPGPRFNTLTVIIVVLFPVIIRESSGEPVPINCSQGSVFSIAKLGEYVWNCSSTFNAGVLDSLRINVPRPNATIAGGTSRLFVEVVRRTFKEIVIDLRDVVQPTDPVNVTVVLTGVGAGDNNRSVMSFNNSHAGVRIVRGNSTQNTSGLIGLGAVWLTVVVGSNVLMDIRNATALLSIEGFPLSASSFVSLDVRSGCMLMMSDVRYLVGVVTVIPGRATVELTISNVSVTLANTGVLVAPATIFAVSALLTPQDCRALTGNIRVTFRQCSILSKQWETHVLSISGLLNSPCYNAISLLVVDSNVSISSAGSSLITLTSTSRLAVSTVSLTMLRSLASFVGGGYVIAFVAMDQNVANVSIVLTSSSIITGGMAGALLALTCLSGSITLSNTTVVLKDSRTRFPFPGAFIFAEAPASITGSYLSLDAASSTMQVSESFVALPGSLFAFASQVVYLSNFDVLLTNSNATFDGDSDMISISTLGLVSVRFINITFIASSLLVGGKGTVLSVSSSQLSATGVTLQIRNGSTVWFNQSGFLFFGNDDTSGTLVRNVTVVLTQSTLFSGQGDIGALVRIDSNAIVSMTELLASVDVSSLRFVQPGHLVIVTAKSGIVGRRVNVTVRSSSFYGGGGGTMLFLHASNGVATLSQISVSALDDSTVESMKVLCLVRTWNGKVRLSDLEVTSIRSLLRFSAIGNLFYLSDANGSVADNLRILVDGSTFFGSGTFLRMASYGGVAVDGITAIVLNTKAVFADPSDCISVIAVNSTTATNVGISISSFLSQGNMSAIMRLSSSSGTSNLSSMLMLVATSSLPLTTGKNNLMVVAGSFGVVASNVAVAIQSTPLTFGPNSSAFGFAAENGSVMIVNLTTAIEGRGTYALVSFQGDGWVFSASAKFALELGNVAVNIIFNSIIVGGGGSLCSLTSVDGDVEATGLVVSLDRSSVAFNKSGYTLACQSSTGSVAVRANLTVSTSNITTMGELVHLRQAIVSGPSSCVVGVLVNKSAVACPCIADTSVPATICVEFNESLFIAAGSSLTALFHGAAATSLSVRRSRLCLRGVTTSGSYIPRPQLQLTLNHQPNGVDTDFISSCTMIGWYDRAEGGEFEQWIGLVSTKFFAGKLDDLALDWRALRKFDVVGSARIRVFAERCAWGRGSREFRNTESFSNSALIPISETHMRLTTHTLLASPSLSIQPPIRAVRRYLASLRGIGLPVLALATSASITCSVSTVVPLIQTIAHRNLAEMRCSAFSDGAMVVPPLSDVTSNPFGVTIPSLGEELMFVGGSVASSLLLGLIYAAIPVIGVPLLRSPRGWANNVITSPLATLRLPGSLYTPAIFVLQPLTTAAVVLLASSSRSAGSVAFGLSIIMFLGTTLGALLWKVWKGYVEKLLTWKTVDPAQAVARHRSEVRWIMWAFGDRCELLPRDPQADASQVYFVRYGCVMSSFCSDRQWFAAVEVSIAAVSGVISGTAAGLDSSVTCSATAINGFNWSLAALSIALVLAVTVWRPYPSYFGNLLSILTSFMAAVCLALESLAPDSAAISSLSWTLSALGFLPLIVELVTLIDTVCATHTHRKDTDIDPSYELFVTTPSAQPTRSPETSVSSHPPCHSGLSRAITAQDNLDKIILLICKQQRALLYRSTVPTSLALSHDEILESSQHAPI